MLQLLKTKGARACTLQLLSPCAVTIEDFVFSVTMLRLVLMPQRDENMGTVLALRQLSWWEIQKNEWPL